jgi:hypothetical protein
LILRDQFHLAGLDLLAEVPVAVEPNLPEEEVF